MDGLNDLALLSNDALEIPHEFSVELQLLVLGPHRFAIDGLKRAEDEEISQLEDGLCDEEYEVVSSAISQVALDFETMRNAANLLAIVGLVTRLQTWIENLARRVPEQRVKSRSRLIGLIAQLDQALGQHKLGFGSLFQELVDVRDSVIHANSLAEWKHREERREVATEYRNAYGAIEVSEDQLYRASAAAVQLVAWFDGRLAERGNLSSTTASP